MEARERAFREYEMFGMDEVVCVQRESRRLSRRQYTVEDNTAITEK